MPGTSHRRTATIVGAGPVGCLVAIGLRRRSFEVNLYESSPYVRTSPRRGPSFNLTLTLRGLASLESQQRELAYAHGVRLPQRVVHRSDGSLAYQRYGTEPEHYLLSVHRGVLHQALLSEAEAAGAKIHFGHECVGVDPKLASATFAVNGKEIQHTEADLLVGCDGANSIVRREMARHGARMHIQQEYVEHGFVELKIPPAPDGGFALRQAFTDLRVPASSQHGFHIWPRGNFCLLAQPNLDRSYTATLFLPLVSTDPAAPGFDTIRTKDDVLSLFATYFADVEEFIPNLTVDFFETPPASLKTVNCSPYHHARTVLIGDSAHTLVPFYGQGINCNFEDVKTFLDILDEAGDQIPEALAQFTRSRVAPGHAIAELSLAHRRELSSGVGESAYQTRSSLEKQLHRRWPEKFTPLYEMVAFTNIPYDEVVRRHEHQRRVVDDLCRRYDVNTELDQIIESYPGHRPVEAALRSELELADADAENLVAAVMARLMKFRAEVTSGQYPASFLYDTLDVAEHTDGIQSSKRLLDYEVPEKGTELDTLLDEIFDIAMPNGTIHPHPGFLAHVPSGGLFQSAVGDFLSHSLNRFVGMWGASPGFTQIEANVIKWLCAIVGYPNRAFGYLTTGGSLATFMGVRCALEQLDESTREKATIYVSSQGHFSVEKAARMAGIPRHRVRFIGTDLDYRMNVAELLDTIDRDRHRGLVPACVVATAGTTNTGAVDDLALLAQHCRTRGIWLHVDACFGGLFRLTDRGRHLLNGMEESDSIAVDAHKSLFLPHGHSALLVRDGTQLRTAFEVPGADYTPGAIGQNGLVDLCNYGPELTREVRGLGTWLPIRLHGVTAFQRCQDHKLDLADDLANRLAQIDGIDVVPRRSPHLPVVAFKLRTDPAYEEQVNLRLCKEICARENVYLATTRLPHEGLVLRACVLHHRTDEAVVDQLVMDTMLSIASVG